MSTTDEIKRLIGTLSRKEDLSHVGRMLTCRRRELLDEYARQFQVGDFVRFISKHQVRYGRITSLGYGLVVQLTDGKGPTAVRWGQWRAEQTLMPTLPAKRLKKLSKEEAVFHGLAAS